MRYFEDSLIDFSNFYFYVSLTHHLRLECSSSSFCNHKTTANEEWRNRKVGSTMSIDQMHIESWSRQRSIQRVLLAIAINLTPSLSWSGYCLVLLLLLRTKIRHSKENFRKVQLIDWSHMRNSCWQSYLIVTGDDDGVKKSVSKFQSYKVVNFLWISDETQQEVSHTKLFWYILQDFKNN